MFRLLEEVPPPLGGCMFAVSMGSLAEKTVEIEEALQICIELVLFITLG